MTSPTNLNEFAKAMDKETEIYKKLTICEALVKYLQNPKSNITFDEQGTFCMTLIQWMASPSLKISLKALDAGLAVLDRMPLVMKPYASACFPALIERYADSKESVRNKVHQVLMNLVDKELMLPQGLHDKLFAHGYLHKNSIVRVESLKCLMNILVIYGAKSVQLSSCTSTLLQLYCDSSEIVREEASTVMVEIYRQVGEKLKHSIYKNHANQVPPQRLVALSAKFDTVKDPALKKFNTRAESSLSRESVDDVADGTSHRRIPVFKTPSASSSRVASMEDLSKKSGVERQKFSTLGRSRGAAAATPISGAGAVDEASFRAAFTDVPTVQIYVQSDLRDGFKTISMTIGNANLDWEKRVDALKKVRSYTLACGDHPELGELIKKLEIPIFESIKDLRSQVVREACITISFLAETLKAKFAYFAELTFPSLITLIQNSTKVMATSAQVAVRFIVENTSSSRLISLTVNHLTSKSKEIRRALFEILSIMIGTWPIGTLEKKHSELRAALQKGVGDADADARLWARKAFCEYKQRFPEKADDLLRSMDASIRRLLSEGSTESVHIQTPGLHRTDSLTRPSTARKPVNSAVKKPVYNRASTAVDPMAVHRAQVRAQYAALTRQKAGSPGRMPPTPSSMVNSSIGMSPEESTRSRSNTRIPRYSRSQPTSRSASPCAQQNYQTYQRSMLRGGLGTPRSSASSRQHSRETSPTRRLPGLVTPSVHPHSRPATSQRMLQQSREAEYALADAFMGNEGDGHEKSSDESESSSLCERTSHPSPITPPNVHDIQDVIEYLNKSDWSCRKDGLISLKYYLVDHSLTQDELKKITELLTKMFMDSQTKVYTLFLETVSAVIQRHWHQLDSWLYILLHKLFTKLGTDVLPTIEKKILNVLLLIRETFRQSILMKETFRFIADPLQVHNTKVRLNILKHLSLLAVASKSKPSSNNEDLHVKDNTVAVLSKIVKWSEVAELKDAASKCIADLFYMNAPLISSILPQLSYQQQLVVDNAVKTFLKSHGSPPGNNVNHSNDDVSKSLQLTSHEIQTYKFDGLSQDSGICPLSPSSPSFSKFNIEERFAAISIKTTPKNSVHSDPPSTEDSHSQSDSYNNSMKGCNDVWGQVLETLRPESDTSIEQKNEAMLHLYDLVKQSDVDTLTPHIVKIIKRLVGMLPSPESRPSSVSEGDHILVTNSFNCLGRLLRKHGLQTHFANFHELLALKTFGIIQCPDYHRSVVAAEECLKTMAIMFPVNPLLSILHNYAFDKLPAPAYAAIKTIQEVVRNHSKEEFDPYFNQTMTVLLLAFDSDFSAVRKAVVFCLVELHAVYGESQLTPYVKKLDSSKKKLLDVYIKKSQKDLK